MVADSSGWVDATEICKLKKIWRIRGGLVGCAGQYPDVIRFVEWCKDDADPDECPVGNYQAITADPTGRVLIWGGFGHVPIPASWGYAAIGAGFEIALGALADGASAKRAVKAAIRHNAHCRGPIRIWHLRKGTT